MHICAHNTPASHGTEQPGCPHSLDGLHPLLLLLRARGGDPVYNMVPLHHTAICLCLAGFDDLPFVTGVVQLKAVLVERREPSQGQGGRGGCKDLEWKGAGTGKPHTGFRGSSTSLMLRFSSGMIPLGSLS